MNAVHFHDSDAVRTLQATSLTTGEVLGAAGIYQDPDAPNPRIDYEHVFDMCLTNKSRDYTWDKRYDCSSFAAWIAQMLNEQGIDAEEIYLIDGKWLTYDQAIANDTDFDPYGEETLYSLCEYGDSDAVAYAWDTYLSPVLTVYGVREWCGEYTLSDNLEGGIGIMWARNDHLEGEGIADPKRCAKGELAEFSAWANGDVYGYQIHLPCGECGEFEATDNSLWGIYDQEDQEYAMSEATEALKAEVIAQQIATAPIHTHILRWLGFGWQLDPFVVAEPNNRNRPRVKVYKWIAPDMSLDARILRWLRLA